VYARRIGLQGTTLANATCGTIRLKLLKVGALVRISVRRNRFAMASACPAPKSGVSPPFGSRLLLLRAPLQPGTPRRTQPSSRKCGVLDEAKAKISG
jgi:hypothetical protein